jgi:hypothetical protein
VNGDNPELIRESHLTPRAALMEYRDRHGYNSDIIHVGGSVFACVTGTGLFLARKAK